MQWLYRSSYKWRSGRTRHQLPWNMAAIRFTTFPRSFPFPNKIKFAEKYDDFIPRWFVCARNVFGKQTKTCPILWNSELAEEQIREQTTFCKTQNELSAKLGVVPCVKTGDSCWPGSDFTPKQWYLIDSSETTSNEVVTKTRLNHKLNLNHGFKGELVKIGQISKFPQNLG